jgi:hypothetical protein
MAGPNSSPQARVGNGVIEGKSALKARGLKSGHGFDWQSKATGKDKGTGKKAS